MVTLLDTDRLVRGERAEAVRTAMRSARIPALLTHQVDDADVRCRLDVWELGGGASLVHRTGSPVRLDRSRRQVGAGAEDRMALTVLSPGRWSFAQFGQDVTVDSPGWGALLVDHAAPYRFVRQGHSHMYAFNVDTDSLGLDRDLVRSAAPRLSRSPVFDLTVTHLRTLGTHLDAVPHGPVTTMLGSAALDLIRAMLLSTTEETVAAPRTPAATLVRQTRRYVQMHFADPGLTPQRIARSHAVSVRRLYQVWAEAGDSLAGHLMSTRLEAASRRLAERASRPATITTIARECGFVDMPHFSRRFRQAYGLSPREWRLQAVTDSGA